ncbi:MAG: flagella basal body P-ring formation protein FlgA [Leptospirales bacterium]
MAKFVKILLFTVFFASTFALVYGDSNNGVAVLKKRAYIRTDHICLQDLVTIKASSKHDTQRENPCLIDTPVSPIYLSLDDVRNYFEEEVSGFKWVGKGVQIIPVMKIVTDREIEDAIFARLATNPRFIVSDYQLSLQDELRLPVNTFAEYSLTGNYLEPGGKYIIVKTRSVELGRMKTVRIRALLRKKISVYIINTESLEVGTRIKAEHVKVLDSYIDDESKIPCKQNPVGGKLVRNLSRGDMVRDKDIRLEADVKKGDLIILQYELKNIRIDIETIAKEPGYIGRSLKLKTVQGNKEITAVLISNDRAVIKKIETHK